MKLRYMLFCLPLIFTSCAIYQRQFDCPPDPGVPCTSVSDLEQMILETMDGPDIFLGAESSNAPAECSKKAKKVWITPSCGKGHYVYLN